MTPELRAIIDRLMFDQATTLHIVTSLPDGGTARMIEGTGGTVAQLVAHFAGSQEACAAALGRWLAGEPAEPPRFSCTTADDEAATLTDAEARLRVSLRALFAAFHEIPDERLGEPFGEATAIDTFHAWERHYLDHALDLVDAAPEVRLDPLVLNWVLHAGFSDERSRMRQRALLEELRAYYASLDDEGDEDEDEDEDGGE